MSGLREDVDAALYPMKLRPNCLYMIGAQSALESLCWTDIPRWLGAEEAEGVLMRPEPVKFLLGLLTLQALHLAHQRPS